MQIEQEKQQYVIGAGKFMNFQMTVLLVLLSAFVIGYVIKQAMIWWKKNKIFAVCLILLGFAGVFGFKLCLKFLTSRLSQKLDQAEKVKFIQEIESKRNMPLVEPIEEFKIFLQQKMFYSGKNLENIINIFQEIKFGHERGFCEKILITGPPGVGKTAIVSAIVRLASEGAMVIGFSALIKCQNALYTDIGEEIKKLNEIVQKCEKKRMILVFEDMDLFLTTRKYDTLNQDELDDTSTHQQREDRAIATFIGILCNFWLSVLSGCNVTIIIVSNITYTTSAQIIDPANARRIQKHFSINLPDLHERIGILKHFLKNYRFNGDAEVVFRELGLLTDGFSGRDIKLLCTNAKATAQYNVIDLSILINIFVRDFFWYKNKQYVINLRDNSNKFFEDLQQKDTTKPTTKNN